jgi:hypothetical protein
MTNPAFLPHRSTLILRRRGKIKESNSEGRLLAASSMLSVVMAGLVPAIHAVVQTTMFASFARRLQQESVQVLQCKLTLYRVDARNKSGHDGEGVASSFGD